MDKRDENTYLLDGKKYQNKIYEIKEYQKEAFVPENEAEVNRLKDTFKVNQYFEILENISMEKGWEIAYEYQRARLGSEPIIIAYKTADYLKDEDNDYKRGNSNERFLKHVKLDQTPDSYFQFIILNIMASQFALGWHANYNDGEIVCTKEMIENILNRKNDLYHFEDHTIKKTTEIEPQIYVKVNSDKVIVRTIIFSKWSGFIELKYHIVKEFPHKIIEIEKESLVEYNCGIVY